MSAEFEINDKSKQTVSNQINVEKGKSSIIVRGLKRFAAWLIELLGIIALSIWTSILLRILGWASNEFGGNDSAILKIIAWIFTGGIVFTLVVSIAGIISNFVSMWSTKVYPSEKGLRYRTVGWFFILYSVIGVVSYLISGESFWWIVSVSQQIVYAVCKIGYASDCSGSELSASDKYIIPIVISICLLIGLYGGVILLVASGIVILG